MLSGALTAPGPIGYGLVIVALSDLPGVLLLVLGIAAPLGAIGGLAFWFV